MQKQQPPVQQPVQQQPTVQPVQQVKQHQPQVVQKTPEKKRIIRRHIDILFICAVLLVIAQCVFLYVLETSKNEYILLKKQDTDRIHIIQKATTVSQKDIDLLEEAFLDESGVVTFIQTIEKTSPYFKAFELKFTSELPQGKDINYLVFTIQAVGDKKVISDFVTTLLSSRFAVEPTQISIEEDTKDANSMTLEFSGSLFVAKDYQK